MRSLVILAAKLTNQLTEVSIKNSLDVVHKSGFIHWFIGKLE